MALIDTIPQPSLREVARLAQEQDWEVKRGGSGHLKFYDADGRFVTTASATPSDYRSETNLRATLARRGLDITTTGSPRRRVQRRRARAERVVAQEANDDVTIPADQEQEQEQEQEHPLVLTESVIEPPVETKPMRPGELVKAKLQECPGVKFDMQRLVDATGLEYKQVHSAIHNLLKKPGFVRPQRGYVMYEPRCDDLKVSRMSDEERMARIADGLGASKVIDLRDDGTPSSDPIAHLRAVAARHNAESGALVERVRDLASRAPSAMPTTLTVLTINRSGNLVVQDENGDLYEAAPMKANF